MNILLLGSGGREHAIAQSLVRSKHCSRCWVAPGNAGTALLAENVNIPVTDFEAIAEFISTHHIGLLVVGPEDPLVLGIRDYFESKKDFAALKIVGPGKLGAQLEGSKDFSKKFMARHGIPTASYATFHDDQLEEAHHYIKNHSLPIVLKADGLAAGKGVLICETLADAQAGLDSILGDKKFGQAGSKVVIEQFLTGIEVSYFAALDGNHFVLLPEAKDYKRIGEGDTGLNTGGMGSISPVPFCDAVFHQKVLDQIVLPTVKGLKKESIDYRGFLFFGLINVGGDPFVIEYNARMGDPETESVFPRIESDAVELMLAIHEQTLNQYTMKISALSAATVFLVAGGYPEDYRKGDAMEIPDSESGVSFFHAGTKMEQGRVVTNGGRVLAVSALSESAESALEKAMIGAQQIQFEGKYFRTDIGKDLISR